MKKVLNFLLICCSLNFSAVYAEAQGLSRINKAIELIKVACAAGEKLEINATADGEISFFTKKGVEGNISFTKEEINGVVKGTNQSLKMAENNDIRRCMQNYVPKILDALLAVKSKDNVLEDDFQYLTNQTIPVDLPLAVLDGEPMLIVTKIYENNRLKRVNLTVEVPYREPYRLSLVAEANQNSGTFEYRDKIYRVTIISVNLQDQNVTLSVVKYKNVKK